MYSCFYTSGCVDAVIPDDLVDIVNSEVLLISFLKKNIKNLLLLNSKPEETVLSSSS